MNIVIDSVGVSASLGRDSLYTRIPIMSHKNIHGVIIKKSENEINLEKEHIKNKYDGISYSLLKHYWSKGKI